MKIIKPGNLNQVRRPMQFKCSNCGCEFEAEQGEYKYGGIQYNITYWVCNCPTCGYTVYTEENPWVKEV